MNHLAIGPIERKMYERYASVHERLCPPPPAKSIVIPLPEPAANKRCSLIFRDSARAQIRPRVYFKGNLNRPVSQLRFPMTLDRRIKIMKGSVALKHGISVLTMLSRRRTRAYVWARHELMYRLSIKTSMSLPAIGRALGGFDHTTVLHGIRKHMRRMAEGTAI